MKEKINIEIVEGLNRYLTKRFSFLKSCDITIQNTYSRFIDLKIDRSNFPMINEFLLQDGFSMLTFYKSSSKDYLELCYTLPQVLIFLYELNVEGVD